MRLNKKAFARGVFACGLAAAVTGLTASAAEKAAKAAPKQTAISGWFVSFRDDVLTIENRTGLVRTKIPATAKALVWNHDERRLRPVETAEAMSRLQTLVGPFDVSKTDSAESLMWRKAGTGLVIQTAGDDITIRIGESKIPPYVGNMVSFKDGQLFIRLRKPGKQFKTDYGDTVRFKMRDDIPVYESIDGEEYKRAGTVGTFLRSVKEGTVLTVFHLYKTEEDEFHLVLVGVKKK